MKKKFLAITASLLVMGGIGVTGSAFALSNSTNHIPTAQKDQGLVSKDKAVQIAQKKYDGDVINVEKETEDGQSAYEVELKNSKQGRIEVNVDGDTGKILGMEKEDGDDNDGKDNDDDQVNSKDVKTSLSEAKSTALKEIGGGKVIESDLDEDDGIAVYEMDITNNGSSYEVKVNANTGKMIEVEKDDD